MKIVKYLFHRYENLKITDYVIHDALKICMKGENIEMINFFIDKLPKNYPLKDIYILSYSRYRSVNEFIKNKLIGRQF